MLKIRFTLCFLLFFTLNEVFALNTNASYDFVYDNIRYKITDYQEKKVELVSLAPSNSEVNLNIPQTVQYEGSTFNVTALGKQCCSGSELQSVTIPATVLSIGEYAFSNCPYLSYVSMQEGILNLGKYVFQGCSSLASISLPNSIKELGYECFCGTAISSFTCPDSLRTIGGWCFCNCKSLTKVTFNDSLNVISDMAFYDCPLAELHLPIGLRSIGVNTFQYAQFKKVIIPQNVTIVQGFQHCEELEELVLPDSVIEITNINHCFKLNKLDLKHCEYLNKIGPSAFAYAAFKELEFPDTVYTWVSDHYKWGGDIPGTRRKIESKLTISGSAFAYLDLEKLVITHAVSNLSGAFKETTIKDVYVKQEVPMSIADESTFTAKTYLTGVLHVPVGKKEAYSSAKVWKNFTNIIDDIIIVYPTYTLSYMVDGEVYKTFEIEVGASISPEPEPIKEGHIFSGWSEIPQTMPAQDVIVTGTFAVNKYKLTYMVDGEEYKSFDVEYGATITPEPAPTKEGYTFSGWSEIPETMPAHDVIVEGSFTQSNSSVEIDGIYYNLNKEEKSAEVVGGGSEYSGIYSGDIVIPSSINYEGISYSVTSIGISAFQYCSVKSVTIPNSVTKICDQAFYNSESIETINMSENVQSIGYAAFCGLEKLKELRIPASVNSIGSSAFCRCKSITSFVIPEGVTSIGTNTFYRCEQLESVVIPSTIKTIEGSAFRECYQLFNMVFPEGLESIGGYAFYMCKQLAKISLPNSIKSIGGHAFANCDDLTEVTSNIENPFEIENVVFECYNKATLFIPKGTREKYENTNPWKRFSLIVEMKGPSYKLSYFVDGNEYKTYEMEYGEIITPEPEPTKEGFSFSGWSEIPETMPDHDVTITGTFIVNKYKLTYMMDGEVYKTYDVEYGATITPEAEPTKEGYTFSGWSTIPETMPAHDVTVTGSFTKGAYKLIYKIDGEVYKTYTYDFGAEITPEPAPTKEGYTFSGWSDIPETMPANDVEVTGSFTVNKYNLIYKVDGDVYKEYEMEYGAEITPEEEPTKEGWEFSGWSWIPKKMPAEDVVITGTFKQLDYAVDGGMFTIDDGEATLKGGGEAKGALVINNIVTINGKVYVVVNIGNGAFKGNKDITSVELPDGIKNIGAGAFDGCSSLLKVLLGKGVKKIGSKAFGNIWKAAAMTRAAGDGFRVECNAESVPEIETDAFEGTEIEKATLVVKDELVNSYKIAEVWKNFGSIIGQTEATDIDGIFTDNPSAVVYSIDGRRLNKVQKGMNVIRTEKGVKKVVVR